MSARSIASFIVAAALAAVTPVAAQTPAPALTAATLAGKWTMTVQASTGPIESALDLKADPANAGKFTGTIASQMGQATLRGEVVDGKVTFGFAMATSGGDYTVTVTATQQKDGSLAGTLNYGQTPVAVTAVRVSPAASPSPAATPA